MSLTRAAEKVRELQGDLMAPPESEQYKSADRKLRAIWTEFDSKGKVEQLIQEVEKPKAIIA